MEKELQALEQNHTWDVVPLPKGKQAISNKWVFKTKHNPDGTVERYKARLVAKGYHQVYGVDYLDSFSPVAKMDTVRVLIFCSRHEDFKLYQMDVKSAFLNGFIQEEVYVKQPPGFENFSRPNDVYKLKKALYGLKQAPRAWCDRLSSFLLQNGFTRGKVDTSLFVFEKGQDCLLVQIYVDDIIFGATNESLCKKFSKLMQGEFEMSMMGELNYFLGLQIKQCQEGIYISQSKYTKELLKNFGIEEGRTVSTPMATNVKIDEDEKGKSVDESKYRGMIGSLLYLTASRLDILHVVCLCARFQSNPKESHMSVVKRIFRYLKGTIQYGLFYPKNENFSLKGYSDSDYAGNIDDQKFNF
ncbi:hypothetical protein DH2020_046826 [Rehmannia glutinosa]|uniref:Reverse transcriptase Ty1/copia-type domain-containing protein n=1 Tax=Rehmannia glutinosa TaxID=99300 RepID=A0ABR0UAV2_REHGL